MAKMAIVAALFLVAGCAGIDISERNTTIVTAKKVVKGQGASDITDTFTLEGQVFALLTFKWDDIEKHGGQQTIEARWFNGEKEISRRKHDANFGQSPWQVWFPMNGTALGVGKCRVDAYVNGKYVGTKSFTVVEK
jgi:hypothetical protein